MNCHDSAAAGRIPRDDREKCTRASHPHPRRDQSAHSVISCRTRRRRVAPMAVRTAISLPAPSLAKEAASPRSRMRSEEGGEPRP